MEKFTTVDEYIDSFPIEVQEKLSKMRETIRKAAPKAEECISYAMPCFKQNGVVCWYAAAKNHYAFYIEPAIKNIFSEQLSEFGQTKSAIHFSYQRKVPVKLITDIVKYKVKYNLSKTKVK